MRIFFKSQPEYDLFFFSSRSTFDSAILLPEKIETMNLLKLFQASLDMLKPVIIAASDDLLSDINLTGLKSKHAHLEKNKYIFLNYSVRNSLSKFSFSHSEITSFEEIFTLIEKNHFFSK